MAAPTVQITGSTWYETSVRIEVTIGSGGDNYIGLIGMADTNSGDLTTGNADFQDGDGTVDLPGAGVYYIVVDGLTVDTFYYIRVYACGAYSDNSSGWTQGVLFPAEPTVTTDSVYDIATDGGTVQFTIVDLGNSNVTKFGVQYAKGSTGGPGGYSEWQMTLTTPQTRNITLTGLDSNSLYYVRGYATNTNGTGYGDWLSFSTLEITTRIKTINDLAKASVKVVNGVAIASVKSINGLE